MLAPVEFAVRTAFLVDGFNLYHSSQDASIDLGGAGTKWLNLECLRAGGVNLHLGSFKLMHGICRHCGRENLRPEEKGTDVALGVRLLELLWTGACDAAVLLTGDNDLAPAIRTARTHFPEKPVFCYFPYKRFGFDLNAVATKSFRMRAKRLLGHQFPDPVRLQDGSEIGKPPDW